MFLSVIQPHFFFNVIINLLGESIIWGDMYYSFMLLIKMRIFNTSIDSFYLNTLNSSLSPRLSRIIERSNVLLIF